MVELGTHSELLAKRGIYHKLNRFQMLSSGEEGTIGEDGSGDAQKEILASDIFAAHKTSDNRYMYILFVYAYASFDINF